MRLDDYAPRPAHLKWLLDSDPAIRWQVMRDLTGEAPNAIAAERSRVATEGWGAQLLALQSPAGNWGGPKWDLITLYSLVVLMDLGLDPASKEARRMIDRVDKRLVFKPLNNRPYLHGETEPCINGRILGIGSYFKEPNDALANQLLGEQLEDGGWNSRGKRRNTVLVPISGIQRAVVEAVDYAKSLSPDVRAVYVNIDPTTTEQLKRQWPEYGDGVPLVILESPYRSLMEPLLEYIEHVYAERPDDYVTIVLPEFVPARWWHHLFHNQRALLIKGALLFKRNTVVTSVPFHLRH